MSSLPDGRQAIDSLPWVGRLEAGKAFDPVPGVCPGVRAGSFSCIVEEQGGFCASGSPASPVIRRTSVPWWSWWKSIVLMEK